jgi:hypothetical protein
MAVQATLGRAAGRQNTIIGPAIRKVLDLGQQGWTCERTNTWLAVPKGALGSAMSRPFGLRQDDDHRTSWEAVRWTDQRSAKLTAFL